MILMIDNYDSFTYNLVQYLGELGEEVLVRRNDAVDPAEVERIGPEAIVISPGPCTPAEAGVSCDIIRTLAGKFPILGVCLGHQCIGQVYGARVVRADRLMHGKTSPVYHDGSSLYAGIPSPFTATRYHSLVIAPDSLPDCLAVTAWTEEGEIMGVRHRTLVVEGVQFHPESILTEDGKKLLANFTARIRREGAQEPSGSAGAPLSPTGITPSRREGS